MRLASVALLFVVACGEEGALDPAALARALDWESRGARWEVAAKKDWLFSSTWELPIPRQPAGHADLPDGTPVVRYPGRGAGLMLASELSTEALENVWWSWLQARGGPADAQAEFIYEVRRLDDERVFEMLLSGLDPVQDAWLVPMLVELLIDPSMSYIAPFTALKLWEHFPEQAAELTDKRLDEFSMWASREMVELAVMAVRVTPTIKAYLNELCKHAIGFNWGMILRETDGGESLRVVYVCAESEAAMAGIRADDVITEQDDELYAYGVFLELAYKGIATHVTLARGDFGVEAIDLPGYVDAAESDASIADTMRRLLE